jgi:acetyl-CoA carboxylase carboxyltransferase component
MDMCDRQKMPLLFVQDVSGFMVGVEAEHSGIIRAGARMVESMATARVPKIVLTTNHASGAGYYAMAGQGFDPDFIFTWPTGRMGVMEGESAVRAIFGPKIDRAAEAGEELDSETVRAIEHTRAEYDKQLDATYAAARGFVDAIIVPEETRDVLDLAMRCSLENPAPHVGTFTLRDDA